MKAYVAAGSYCFNRSSALLMFCSTMVSKAVIARGKSVQRNGDHVHPVLREVGRPLCDTAVVLLLQAAQQGHQSQIAKAALTQMCTCQEAVRIRLHAISTMGSTCKALLMQRCVLCAQSHFFQTNVIGLFRQYAVSILILLDEVAS